MKWEPSEWRATHEASGALLIISRPLGEHMPWNWHVYARKDSIGGAPIRFLKL